MSIKDWDNQAIAWYKSLSFWTGSAVAAAIGFVAGAILF